MIQYFYATDISSMTGWMLSSAVLVTYIIIVPNHQPLKHAECYHYQVHCEEH